MDPRIRKRRPDLRSRGGKTLGPLLGGLLGLLVVACGRTASPDPVPVVGPDSAQIGPHSVDDEDARAFAVAGALNLDGEMGFVVLTRRLRGMGRAEVWFVTTDGRPRLLTHMTASGFVEARMAGSQLVVRRDEGDTLAVVDLIRDTGHHASQGAWRTLDRVTQDSFIARSGWNGEVFVASVTRDGLMGLDLTSMEPMPRSDVPNSPASEQFGVEAAPRPWMIPLEGTARLSGIGDVDGDGHGDLLVLDESSLRIVSIVTGCVLDTLRPPILPDGKPARAAYIGGAEPTAFLSFQSYSSKASEPHSTLISIDLARNELRGVVRRASEAYTPTWSPLGAWLAGEDGDSAGPGVALTGDGQDRAWWLRANDATGDVGFPFPGQRHHLVTGAVTSLDGQVHALLGTTPKPGVWDSGSLTLWAPEQFKPVRVFHMTPYGLR